jgi:hypothetical protein
VSEASALASVMGSPYRRRPTAGPFMMRHPTVLVVAERVGSP